MHAWEIMSKPVVHVTMSTPVREATAALVDHGFAAMPVVNRENRVVGIFTEADALRCGSGFNGVVADFMTSPVEVVYMDADVDHVARQMLGDRLRCVPVVEDGVLVGVVSRRDLLRRLISSDDSIAGRLRSVLTDYSGSGERWNVRVADGVALISGQFEDEAERRVIALLARTVAGVERAELLNQAPA
ncbi:CBS domain-containing protein [Amycolatopsis pithecellobii]|uniref:CBS domain-containing protein n=1 Tax=Amycolatopsis pithecellobii TaxID=664692 RepID=A0A6N7ZBV4_9PSEU|nr:CBS domain-containing protein [Amycolatopsis pithecellobii]MTD59198.1 CBS domain-containing protein [Amycolatopsis pithecellobii]